MKTTRPEQISESAWNALDKLRGVEFRGPEELAIFLSKEDAQFSARDLIAVGPILATRFGRYGGMFHVPEWLADVICSIAADISPRTICDPWAGVGFLLGLLHETTKAKTAIAFTHNQGEMALGKVLVPQAEWRIGDPLRLIRELSTELDVVASVLPMNLKSQRPLSLTLPSGEAVEVADDVGNLLLVAGSLRLSAAGIGLFVVTPSFFLSARSVFHRLGDMGIGIEAAFSLPPGTFAPYTKFPAYLVVVRHKPANRMFVAQLSADINTNRQIIKNFGEGREGGSIELGRFVDPGSFAGFLRRQQSL